MTYLSGRAERKRKQILYGAAAFFFVIVLMAWPFIQYGGYSVLSPFVKGYGYIKNSFLVFPEFVHTYATSHKKLAENEKVLEATVERLENELALKDARLREIDLQNGASSTRAMPPVIAYPIVRDVLEIYSTIILSKGYKDGIEVGDFVYLRGRQVVCTIEDVYTSTSRCALLNASGVSTEGITASSSIVMNLIGRGGYYIANVVRDTPVTLGEKVYLRSDPSMVLGEVVDIANNNQDTSWHIFIRGAYNPANSSYFYVQKK